MNSSLVDKFLGIFNSTNLEKAAQIVSAAT